MLGRGKYGSSQSRLVKSDEDTGVATESDVWRNSEKDVINLSCMSLEGISNAEEIEQKLKGSFTRSISRAGSV